MAKKPGKRRGTCIEKERQVFNYQEGNGERYMEDSSWWVGVGGDLAQNAHRRLSGHSHKARNRRRKHASKVELHPEPRMSQNDSGHQ